MTARLRAGFDAGRPAAALTSCVASEASAREEFPDDIESKRRRFLAPTVPLRTVPATSGTACGH